MRAIEKYGKENFTREILSLAYSKEELDLKEKQYIKSYNAIQNKEFYNIHVGGSGGDTYTGRSEKEKQEYKKKMSTITRGENNGMYGRTHSQEARNKIRLNRDMSNYKTLEFKKVMSEVTKGKNNGMYGKKHSYESKKEMSKNSKGKTLGSKNGMYGMKGEKALNGKSVYQYIDEELTLLVGSFNSVGCVLDYLKLKGHTGLYKAMKNNTKYKDYYWSKQKKGVETIETAQ